MYKINLILFLNILLASKIVSIQTVAKHADAADDAEAALDNLRLVVAYEQNEEAFLYANFSKTLVTTALTTKAATVKEMQEISKNFDSHFESISNVDKKKSRLEFDIKGLEEIYVADVTDCVNYFFNQSINIMYDYRIGYMNFPLQCIALLENEKVACGKTDDVCLTKLIKNINYYIVQVPENINMFHRYVATWIPGCISRIQSCKEQTLSRFQEAVTAELDRIKEVELYT